MKILEVATYSYPDHAGGAERVITEVCRGLAARGHEVELITGSVAGGRVAERGAPPTLETQREGSLTVHRYPLEPGRVWQSARLGVHRAVAEGAGAEADVLHLHQIASALPALVDARRLGVKRRARLPRLLSFYAPYHLEFLARHRDGREAGGVALSARVAGFGLRVADRRVLGRADRVLALSDYSRRQIAALSRRALARTTLSTGGVDLTTFRPPRDAEERAADRAHFELDDAEPVILSVRRLVPRMGLRDLLDAFARLHADGLRARLCLAGDGPERAPLEERARELGVHTAVRLLGRVPDADLPRLYRAADLFCLPTRGLEGFGLVTAEALASGLPVVATRVGATPEVLQGLDAASLVDPERPDALADALAAWLGDPERRRAAGAAARVHAERALGWEHHVGHVEQACRELLEGAR